MDLTPSIITIFGITGDLAHRKVVPALYRLFKNNLLGEQTYVVGTSRRSVDPAQIMDMLRHTIDSDGEAFDEAALQRLAEHFTMIQVDPDNDDDYERLKAHLLQVEQQAGVDLQPYFYLSIPPQVFSTIVGKLGEHGLNHGSRLLVEKPFGYNLASAKQLIQETARYFQEDQLFRIDHYLAKETAQNILVFRQQNPLFRDIWNNKHITKVSITAAEAIGIEGRANFYDNVGTLRDFVQSHLLQLLALTLMELPQEMSAEAIHQNKQAVLQALQPADPTNTVRGQYDTYKQEAENPDSITETFAAMVLYSNESNWKQVPLHLTSGKALKAKRTSITVDFTDQNRLQFRIQPNEGITLSMQVKQPGLATEVTSTTLAFDYQTAFAVTDPLDAYERVLLDAIRGDHTLFATDEEVLASWQALEPILDNWQASGDGMQTYATGSDGPDVRKLLEL